MARGLCVVELYMGKEEMPKLEDLPCLGRQQCTRARCLYCLTVWRQDTVFRVNFLLKIKIYSSDFILLSPYICLAVTGSGKYNKTLELLVFTLAEAQDKINQVKVK